MGSTAAVIAVGRLIERWLEKKGQVDQLKLLIKAHTVSPEAGAAVGRVVEKYSDVAKSMPLPEIPDITKFNLGFGSSGAAQPASG
jgi:hypothetical protein